MGQMTGTRLKVNGQDFGRITGSFAFSREAVAEKIDDSGIAYVSGASEVRIDTDISGMMLAEVPHNLVERLAFAEQMIAYLRSSQSQHGDNPYRPEFVPSRVRLLHRVTGDIPFMDNPFAQAGEHSCESNQWGAISVKATDGQMLGVRPSEFEILEFVRNPHLE